MGWFDGWSSPFADTEQKSEDQQSAWDNIKGDLPSLGLMFGLSMLANNNGSNSFGQLVGKSGLNAMSGYAGMKNTRQALADKEYERNKAEAAAKAAAQQQQFENMIKWGTFQRDNRAAQREDFKAGLDAYKSMQELQRINMILQRQGRPPLPMPNFPGFPGMGGGSSAGMVPGVGVGAGGSGVTPPAIGPAVTTSGTQGGDVKTSLRWNNPLGLSGGEAGSNGYRVFDDIESAYPAYLKQLQKYQAAGSKTARDLITGQVKIGKDGQPYRDEYAWSHAKWGNPTDEYMKVLQSRGIDVDAPIDLNDPQQAARLLSAMGYMEQGQAFGDQWTPERVLGAIQRGQAPKAPAAMPVIDGSASGGKAPAPMTAVSGSSKGLPPVEMPTVSGRSRLSVVDPVAIHSAPAPVQSAPAPQAPAAQSPAQAPAQAAPRNASPAAPAAQAPVMVYGEEATPAWVQQQLNDIALDYDGKYGLKAQAEAKLKEFDAQRKIQQESGQYVDGVGMVNKKTGVVTPLKDDQGNPMKTPKEQKEEDAAANQKELTTQTAGIQLSAIDDAINLVENGGLGRGIGVTGYTGSVLSMLSNTDARRLLTKLDTIKGGSLVNMLMGMKSASSNGSSGFGALDKSEGKALVDALGSLDTWQGDASLVDNLKQIRAIYSAALKRAGISEEDIKNSRNGGGKDDKGGTDNKDGKSNASGGGNSSNDKVVVFDYDENGNLVMVK